jgi:hypothetical protein
MRRMRQPKDNDDGTGVNHDIPPQPVDLLFDTLGDASEENTWYPMYSRDIALRQCEECPWYGSIPSWYLTTPEPLPPIGPQLLIVLEPQKNRTRGRPKGAKNKPTSFVGSYYAGYSYGQRPRILVCTELRPDSKSHYKKAAARGLGEAEIVAALKKQLAARSFHRTPWSSPRGYGSQCHAWTDGSNQKAARLS